jgi:sugar transferase (PEP-CTERM/EpsH1 system associated)
VKVLFLVTRLPVPPWRGDQVRAYHHLRILAARHEITCAALVAREPSAELRAEVEALGVRLVVIRLGLAGAVPSLARALAGDRRPFQVLLYLRRRAVAAVRRLVAEGGFDVTHAQLVRAAPYCDTARPVVVDLIDALSLNFTRRAAAEGGPLGWLAAHEAARLARFEKDVVARAAVSLVVSEHERAALGSSRVRVVPNGVQSDAFPFRENGRPPARIVFAGNLGYFPNVDAAEFLAHDIFPRVRRAIPAAELRLVGARPARAVCALATEPGVSLAADVPAMAPELAAATVAVVPMRAGSGLQNKALEAMAVGTPVVTTPRVAAALAVRPGEHLLVASDAESLAAAAIDLLRNPTRARSIARAAHELVARQYRWEDSAGGVEAAWQTATARRSE